MEEKSAIVQQESSLFEAILRVLEHAHSRAKTAINIAMVQAYFEVGRLIVQAEQQGAQRAAYGKKLLENLSVRLIKHCGKGFSVTNLKQMRQFYLVYSADRIGQTASDQFESDQTACKDFANALCVAGKTPEFCLSWSHYLVLMRMKTVEERQFYEIESAKNDWSLSELKRQYHSSLYERLALSMDKAKVASLAKQGQVIEQPKDLVKDPYVLEFLGLPELPEFSESELERRLIDHLEQFLLELGTGLMRRYAELVGKEQGTGNRWR